jgi:hypothetical protein
MIGPRGEILKRLQPARPAVPLRARNQPPAQPVAAK